MKNNQIQPHYFTDAEGRRLVSVPVTHSGRRMVTEAVLFDNARERGDLTGRPFLSGAGKVRRYVYAWHGGRKRNCTVARLLIGCTKGYRVRFVDGDPLNLLPENFCLVATWMDSDMARVELETLLIAARRSPAGEPEGTGNV